MHVFDPQILMDSCMGLEDLAKQAVNSFRMHSEGDLVEILGAVRSGDSDRVRAIAHRLKGGAAAVGAVELQHAAAAIEASAREGVLTGAEDAVKQMAAARLRYLDATRALVDDGPPPASPKPQP